MCLLSRGVRPHLIVTALLLTWSGTALAQQTSPPAPAPAPLFPRHRRGMYRNAQGLEVVDATPQSPPLKTDDPGVPDPGEYEINLTTGADLTSAVRRFDLLLVDANYGLEPTIAGHALPAQVKLEFPVAATSESDRPLTAGIGTAAAGLKLNVYRNEHTGTVASFYPQLVFSPVPRNVEKGLADPGQTVLLPLLVAKELKYFILVANGGIEVPMHRADGEVAGTAALAVGTPLTRKLAAMVEVRGESTFDLNRDRELVLNGGLIRGIRRIVVYGQVGGSLFSEDGLRHAYLGGGMKLLIHEKKS
jgi:hypothetical protein